MRHEVLLTRSAERDLADIHAYAAEHASAAAAERLLARLSDLADTLSRFPERGNYPKELASLGIRSTAKSHSPPIE